MNERIKQFADEAYAVCGKHSNDYNGPAFTEKFAELIVFECIKIAVFKGDSATGKAIKEHFGVDE
jgi:hypothetical protein